MDTLHTVDGVPLGVDNAGTIKAEGGTVLLTARQLDGVVSSVVNNSGLVSAASAEMAGGKIVFKGEGAQVDVSNTGVVDASSAKSDGGSVRMTADGKVSSSGTVAATGGAKGGSVVLTGSEVELAKGLVDTSGQQGGGTVLVGGNAQGQGPERNAAQTTVGADVVIRADAVSSGDGGQVVVWSDNSTVFDGTISARGGANGGDGGWVETSGQTLKVGDMAKVDTSATKGKFGTWLLDPADFVIGPAGGIQNIDTGELIVSDMTGLVLTSNLQLGNVTIQSSQGQSGTNGDISIYDDVIWSSNTILTLSAYRDVNINANITATGDTAGLNIAPATGDSTGAFNLASWATVTLSGANPSLSISGLPYTVINTVEDLQAINQNIAGDYYSGYYVVGYYALGSNIDASNTSTWNNGLGFVPIGNNDTAGSRGFEGTFDGLGHVIIGLTINSPTYDDVGLFGTVWYGQLRNTGLVNAIIVGGNTVGALVASLPVGNIYNCYSTGTVNGGGYVGGLVGFSEGGIFNSYSTATVNGYDTTVTSKGDGSYVGGLVGVNQLGTISNSYSTGAVTGNDYVGGFVGENGTGSGIYNSYSTGAVTGDTNVGGFVGNTHPGMFGDSLITNSYSTGAVTGNTNVGGFAGKMYYGRIFNSYSTGTVSGISEVGGFLGMVQESCDVSTSFSMGAVTGQVDVGGFVGRGNNYSSIYNSYSMGAVSGNTNVGGFVGNNSGGYIGTSYSTGAVSGDSNIGGFAGGDSESSGSIYNSYWDIETSGMTTSAGGTGLTTAEMRTQASFNGWDFTNIWSINEGHNYPKLRNVGGTGNTGGGTTDPGADPGTGDSTGGETGGGTTDPGTGGGTGDETGGGTGTGDGNNPDGNVVLPPWYGSPLPVDLNALDKERAETAALQAKLQEEIDTGKVVYFEGEYITPEQYEQRMEAREKGTSKETTNTNTVDTDKPITLVSSSLSMGSFSGYTLDLSNVNGKGVRRDVAEGIIADATNSIADVIMVTGKEWLKTELSNLSENFELYDIYKQLMSPLYETVNFATNMMSTQYTIPMEVSQFIYDHDFNIPQLTKVTPVLNGNPRTVYYVSMYEIPAGSGKYSFAMFAVTAEWTLWAVPPGWVPTSLEIRTGIGVQIAGQ